MKTDNQFFALRSTAVVAHCALMALALIPIAPDAFAQDLTEAELTHPVSNVEVGVTGVDRSSYKFGEYNGLQKSGATPNVNIELRGGSNYDSGGVTRYRFIGEDLSSETRHLQGEVGEQGRFRFNFGYDELLRNRSDSYQTPVSYTHLTLPTKRIV